MAQRSKITESDRHAILCRKGDKLLKPGETSDTPTTRYTTGVSGRSYVAGSTETRTVIGSRFLGRTIVCSGGPAGACQLNSTPPHNATEQDQSNIKA